MNSEKINMAVIVRAYAKSKEQVAGIVERTGETVEKIRRFQACASHPFSYEIIIVIPEDYDCGWTEMEMYEMLRVKDIKENVSILCVGGHHSSEALTKAQRVAAFLGSEYVMILSNKAIKYFNEESISKINKCINEGMTGIAVRIRELDEVHLIPFSNTFAVYHLFTLLEAGCFRSESEVEEIQPIVSMAQKFEDFGKALAVIRAEGELAVRKTGDGQSRHNHVKNTKTILQNNELSLLGVSKEWLLSKIEIE